VRSRPRNKQNFLLFSFLRMTDEIKSVSEIVSTSSSAGSSLDEDLMEVEMLEAKINFYVSSLEAKETNLRAKMIAIIKERATDHKQFTKLCEEIPAMGAFVLKDSLHRKEYPPFCIKFIPEIQPKKYVVKLP
jgi:tRNA G10  N-methylase Trm11